MVLREGTSALMFTRAGTLPKDPAHLDVAIIRSRANEVLVLSRRHFAEAIT